jgi:hypothetical protein
VPVVVICHANDNAVHFHLTFLVLDCHCLETIGMKIGKICQSRYARTMDQVGFDQFLVAPGPWAVWAVCKGTSKWIVLGFLVS